MRRATGRRTGGARAWLHATAGYEQAKAHGRRGTCRMWVFLIVLGCVCVAGAASRASAHDPKGKKLPPTKSTADARAARAAMDAAKRRLAADGRYACCIKPACDLCARVNGSCACAASVAQGKGACGECFAGWKAGRGAMSGIRKDTVTLSPSTEHAVHGDHAPPPELAAAREAINRAKRTMVGEGRYSCCAKQGGCDECAHEGVCGCGPALAESTDATKKEDAGDTGVCGQCLDAWHRGQGAFAGVDVSEVHLSQVHGAMAMTTLAGGPYRTHGAVGSGTSWLPASTPMHAWHFAPGEWTVMLHGMLRAGVNVQTGPRGVANAESQNWLMVMADRPVGPGSLSLRGMFSAESLTAPPGGFPQLFQTGEEFRGREIVDAQHPHDLFMELAAAWTVPVRENVTVQAYGGVVGEPALGPVAFMHRASSAENPAAPLGHHWQDSTHISHGVFTGGISFRKLKFEASAFHGAEPDSNRADIEMGAIDSWSARVWFAPSRDWTMQVSAGRLNEPEATEPGDTVRTTASVHHDHEWEDGSWATSLVWGRNDRPEGDSNAYLFESTVRFGGRNALYGRIELVDKLHLLEANVYGRAGLDESGDGLAREFRGEAGFLGTARDRSSGRGIAGREWAGVPGAGFPWAGVAGLGRPGVGGGEVSGLDGGGIDVPGAGDAGGVHSFEPSFRVAAFTIGYVRDVYENEWFSVGVGADVTAHAIPGDVARVYGASPMSVKAFVRFRPSAMR